MTPAEFYKTYPAPDVREWFDSRPKRVQEIILRYPPSCYRSTENPGHYLIYSYDEPLDDGPITVTVIHGRDSFLPGVTVFGVSLNSLLWCDCGNWEMTEKMICRACEEGRHFECEDRYALLETPCSCGTCDQIEEDALQDKLRDKEKEEE